MARKIKIGHREVELEIFLEILAVYAVLALVLTGIYYLEPVITGFTTVTKDYDYNEAGLELSDSESVIMENMSMILFLVFILITFSLVIKFINFEGGNVQSIPKKEASRKKDKKFKVIKSKARDLKNKEIWWREELFDFFHGIGWTKTKEEKEEEIEYHNLERQVRGLGESLEKERQEAEKSKGGLEDLEKHIISFADTLKKKKEPKKVGLFGLKKTLKEGEVKKQKQEVRVKRKDKSRKFIECHKRLLKADEELQKNNRGKAKNLYTKARHLYTKLEYIEKTDLYDDLMTLYNRLGK